jgi:hypothetical protein
MRKLLIALLPLLAVGCAAHDAGSALEVKARSKGTRVGPSVTAIVRSFARERAFRRLPGSEASGGPQFQAYLIAPPQQPAGASLYVFPESDIARIEISETCVWRPSPAHVEVRRALKTRLEVAGFIVSRTEPHIIVTF